jgi:hypothetical protein
MTRPSQALSTSQKFWVVLGSFWVVLYNPVEITRLKCNPFYFLWKAAEPPG